jgi:16S rRNA (cytosine1402-N4)-methyltransferase
MDKLLAPTLAPDERVTEVKKTLQRSSQALRIAVNDDIGVPDRFLAALPAALETDARVAILSFHSGEDRRVKNSFQSGERSGVHARVAPELIRPSLDEGRANPWSTLATLRCAVRAAAQGPADR